MELGLYLSFTFLTFLTANCTFASKPVISDNKLHPKSIRKRVFKESDIDTFSFLEKGVPRTAVYEDLVVYLIPLLSAGAVRFNTGQRERHGLLFLALNFDRNRWALLAITEFEA